MHSSESAPGASFHAALELDAAAFAEVQARVRTRVLRTIVKRGLIDATKPWGRVAEFERNRIPREGAIRLDDYLQARRLVSAARPVRPG